MKLNKEEFLKTEFGRDLRFTLVLYDRYYIERSKYANQVDWSGFDLHNQGMKNLGNRWYVFKLAMKHFYGIEYIFRRTDEYYGVCTKDGSDWLFKVERKIDGKGE